MNMANTTQDELYQTFLSVSGQQTTALGDTTTTLADVVAQVGEMLSAIPAPVTPPAQSSSGATSGSGSTLGSVASTVLESGLGLVPLVSGLVSLFSGGSSTPAPLVKYAKPPAASFQAEESQGQVTGVAYDQTGMPRSYAPVTATGSTNGTTEDFGEMGMPLNSAPEAVSASGSTAAPQSYAAADPGGGASSSGNGSGNTGGTAAPQITVNVQAMDARSFLDRSSDIAAAVRDAMLNMNSINDVMNDL